MYETVILSVAKNLCNDDLNRYFASLNMTFLFKLFRKVGLALADQSVLLILRNDKSGSLSLNKTYLKTRKSPLKRAVL